MTFYGSAPVPRPPATRSSSLLREVRTQVTEAIEWGETQARDITASRQYAIDGLLNRLAAIGQLLEDDQVHAGRHSVVACPSHEHRADLLWEPPRR